MMTYGQEVMAHKLWAPIRHTLIMNFDSHVSVLNPIECVLRSMIKSLCGSSSLRQLSKSHFTKNGNILNID